MSGDVPQESPKGAVPLSAAIAALRDEMTRAWQESRGQRVRFRPSPVELTLQVAVTSGGRGNAGVKWWLIELGGEVSRESAVTQIVKLTLDPVMVDEAGQPREFLIDAPGGSADPPGGGETSLEAAG